MSDVNWPFSFARLNRVPLDASFVFPTMAAFNTYRTSGPAYAGQLVAVRNGTNTPDVFRINEDYTYSAIAGVAEGITTGGTTPPASPNPGDLWTTIDGQVFVWAGDFWVQVG